MTKKTAKKGTQKKIDSLTQMFTGSASVNYDPDEWELIGGRGKLGATNWGAGGGKEKNELKPILARLKKRVGEKILLTGGGGSGACHATLKGAEIKEYGREGKYAISARLVNVDPPVGGNRSFDPWLDSWQISVKRSGKKGGRKAASETKMEAKMSAEEKLHEALSRGGAKNEPKGDGVFFCKTCLVDRPKSIQSVDPRYCKQCHDFLMREAAALEGKRTAKWIPIDFERTMPEEVHKTKLVDEKGKEVDTKGMIYHKEHSYTHPRTGKVIVVKAHWEARPTPKISMGRAR